LPIRHLAYRCQDDAGDAGSLEKGKAGFPDEPGIFGIKLVAKELREPAGAVDGFFGFCGQVLFL